MLIRPIRIFTPLGTQNLNNKDNVKRILVSKDDNGAKLLLST